MSHSQISQFSDNYPSSIYEDTPLDSSSFLPSDGPQLFFPDASYSQQTPASTPDAEFARPLVLPSIANTLERVGPEKKKKNHLLWTEMVNDEFVAWWLKTEFGSRLKRNIFENKRQAECWKHFHQVASIQDGSPKDMCKICSQILNHPADGHRGTSSMNKHLQGVNCRRVAPHSQDIRRFIQEGLPTGAKLSIALDCWTSPFRQAFMAVTGYFINEDWNYHEILLGFEPLHGTHTGVNLSSVLLDLLQKHGIEDRVLTVTTNNASNNSTLVESIQDSLQSLKLPNQTPIIHIPCMAHIIQLGLKELLGRMEANPRNEREEMEWTEEENGAQRENQEIVYTLNKVRQLAVYINKSPQRREAFQNLQITEPKLVPIQDVRTRWNSTYLMLRRAKRLQSVFDGFCAQYSRHDLQLSQEEWRQIDYLLAITQPFFMFTTTLSKTKDITVHTIFGIYNKLFSHLERSMAQLARKKVNWKAVMLSALKQAKLKLSEYYSMTNDIHDDLYAIGTILAPQNKLHFFSTKEWEPCWRVRYRKSLEDYLVPYQQRYSDTQPISNGHSPADQISDIDMLITSATSFQPQTNAHSELTRYLGSSMLPSPISHVSFTYHISRHSSDPRLFWKDQQHEYPILASLARDVLTTPATGSGVERLFNSARDICHYRRGSLKPNTIKDLMMSMCTSRFDIESEQLTFVNEYLTAQEIQAAREEQDARKAVDKFDPISDNEEDAPAAISPPIQLPSERALGKRPRTEATEHQGPLVELDNEDYQDEIPLPDNSDLHGESNTQRRTSGRVPKRSKRDEDQFVYQKP
ncbi:hypothetical protein GB937_010790 [Aspergillus fischeri]|nr:hypothetical protein GB937_010790 [Aspergillus fischeri]